MSLGGRSKTHPRSILRADEKTRALDLRRAKYSYRAIATELDCSLDKAHKLVDEALRELPAENVEQLRTVEGQSLDESERRLLDIIATHSPAALRSGAKGQAASRVIFDAEARLDAVRARRHKLMGANAPERTEVTGKDGAPLTLGEPGAYDDVLRSLAKLADSAAAGSSDPKPDA